MCTADWHLQKFQYKTLEFYNNSQSGSFPPDYTQKKSKRKIELIRDDYLTYFCQVVIETTMTKVELAQIIRVCRETINRVDEI